MLAAPVRVQAEPEADVRAVVLGQDGAARVAVEDGGRRRGVAVRVGLELDVEWLVAVRRIRGRSPAGHVRARHGAPILGSAAGAGKMSARAAQCWPLAAGHGPHDQKGLGSRRDRIGQWGVGRFVGQILLAGEEPQEKPA